MQFRQNFNKVVFSFVIAATCVLLHGAANARIIQVGQPSKEIQVYENSNLNQSFVVVGKVTVSAPVSDQLLDKIKEKAQWHGGDAVIRYRVLRQGSLPYVGADGETEQEDQKTRVSFAVGEQKWPIAEGVVVKYQKTGITALTDDTVIPVLP